MQKKENVIFDKKAFKGIETITFDQDSYSREYGLIWKLSPEETIKELQRLYAIEEQYEKQNDILQRGELIKP